MYLKKVNPSEHPSADALGALRSVTRDFVFVSQNDMTRFAADGCIDVLRSANALIGNSVFSWTHVDAKELSDTTKLCTSKQTLVLAGGIHDPWHVSEDDLPQFRCTLRTAARLCIIGSAIFVPLSASILKTQKTSVHPEFRAAVKERGYLCDFHEENTCHQPSISSAVSPAAGIEMMIDLVGALEGNFIAGALRAQLGLSSDHSSTRSREHWHYKRLAEGNPVVSEALDIMLDHLEDTLTVGQIASIMAVSPRRLERSFGEKLRQSPLQVYRSLRLEQAEKLLIQTELSISEISVACGFSNVTLLTKWYRQKFGIQPSIARKKSFIGKYAA